MTTNNNKAKEYKPAPEVATLLARADFQMKIRLLENIERTPTWKEMNVDDLVEGAKKNLESSAAALDRMVFYHGAQNAKDYERARLEAVRQISDTMNYAAMILDRLMEDLADAAHDIMGD